MSRKVQQSLGRMKELYEAGVPLAEISSELNISKSTITSYARKCGWLSQYKNAMDFTAYNSRILEIYPNFTSYKELADEVGVSPSYVRKFCVENGLVINAERLVEIEHIKNLYELGEPTSHISTVTQKSIEQINRLARKYGWDKSKRVTVNITVAQQQEIKQLVFRGIGNKLIAEKLNIPHTTVCNFLRQIKLENRYRNVLHTCPICLNVTTSKICNNCKSLHPQLVVDNLRRRLADNIARDRLNNKEKLTLEELITLYGKQNFACGVCGEHHERLHIGHIVPVARGGETTKDNIILLCPTCNSNMGQFTLWEYLFWNPPSKIEPINRVLDYLDLGTIPTDIRYIEQHMYALAKRPV